MANQRFFATAPRGAVNLLAEELRTLGAEEVREIPGGVHFSGELEIAYLACLWSRTASRILLPIADFSVSGPDELYEAVLALPWAEHLDPDGTLAVDIAGHTKELPHSQYAAQRVKDAIVDQFRTQIGRRPSVDLDRPSLRINLHLHTGQAVLSLDLTGESLHRRGYRDEAGIAPVKENLAAAILLRAGWPTGSALLDPLCGGGTFLIEGAWIAGDCAPGLLRDYWGFTGWLGHQPAVWKRLTREAQERCEAGLLKLPPIVGYDASPNAVRVAIENVERAKLHGHIHIERRELTDCTAPKTNSPGLVVVNPPYGERLGEIDELAGLYARLGEVLMEQCPGWEAAVFTGNLELGKRLGIRAWRTHPMDNGPIECRLLRIRLLSEWKMTVRPAPAALRVATPEDRSSGAQMFANRLRKNLKEIGSWARQEGIDCYRLYDADMPEYALAIDLYHGQGKRWVHCQEYEAPSTIDHEKAATRLKESLAVIPEVLEVPQEQIFFKVRKRQKGKDQYERQNTEESFFEVQESGSTFFVNFTDHLDTGLFLDHRLTRTLIREQAKGKHFLNLYAYTGTATVHAAAGGALSTTSVDLSSTYLGWARRNLARNGFFLSDTLPTRGTENPQTAPARHDFIIGDVLPWLKAATKIRRRYGLIFLDPPTFSRSKRMEGVLDLQRDYIELILAACALLEPEGTLLFSTHSRRFHMDRSELTRTGWVAEDISQKTIAPDFARNQRIHQCWSIRKLRETL